MFVWAPEAWFETYPGPIGMPSTTECEVEECDHIKVNLVSPDPVEEKMHIDQTMKLSSRPSFSRHNESVILSAEINNSPHRWGQGQVLVSLYGGDLSNEEEEANGKGGC